MKSDRPSRPAGIRLRNNREIERAAVNEVRAFFERNECVFQPVDADNDYGKDAYVDLTEHRELIGVCFAVQIKGGKSYRRRNGYGVPIGNHLKVWRDSTIPVIAIVHDEEAGLLCWENITRVLLDQRDVGSEIFVPGTQVLTGANLRFDFRAHVEATARALGFGRGLLALSAGSEEEQFGAIRECFAAGRGDARALILLRNSLRTLKGRSLFFAVHTLAHITDHPDFLWSGGNWIPENVGSAVAAECRWSVEEIDMLLRAMPLATFTRGGIGQSLYMLLRCDPALNEALAVVAERAGARGDLETSYAAMYIAVTRSGSRQRQVFDAILARTPALVGDECVESVRETLAAGESVYLFG